MYSFYFSSLQGYPHTSGSKFRIIPGKDLKYRQAFTIRSSSYTISIQIIDHHLCSEARRHNANIRPTQPLRPLLRPLPTPQQSPTCIVKRMLPPTTPMDPSPLSAFPRLKVPAPTPIATSSHCLMIPGGSNQYIQVTPPTPSPLFPRDLKSLFALGPDAARRLLRDYGIDGKDEQSPATDEPCPKAAPRSSIPESPIGSPLESDDEHHEQRIHRFMFHIGVRAYSSSSSLRL